MNGFLFDFANFAIGAAASSVILATPSIINKIRYGRNGNHVDSVRNGYINDLLERRAVVERCYATYPEKFDNLTRILKEAFPNTTKEYTSEELGVTEQNQKKAIDFFNEQIQDIKEAKNKGKAAEVFKYAQKTWIYNGAVEEKLFSTFDYEIKKINETKLLWVKVFNAVPRFEVRVEQANEKAKDIYERFDHVYFESLPSLQQSMNAAFDMLKENGWVNKKEASYVESLSTVESLWNKTAKILDSALSDIEDEIYLLNAYQDKIFPHTKRLRMAIRNARMINSPRYTEETLEKLKEKALEAMVVAEMASYVKGNPKKQYESYLKNTIAYFELLDKKFIEAPK